MLSNLFLFRLLLATFAGWVSQNLQGQLEYVLEENRVFKEQLKGCRARLTDDQRRRLAAKAKDEALGRRVLAEIADDGLSLSSRFRLPICVRRVALTDAIKP